MEDARTLLLLTAHGEPCGLRRVCTSSGTWSPWLGTSTSPKPQIYCLDARDYLGNYLDAYLISVVVSMDAVRIKSLGAVVRRVSEQNIFSYTWAKGTHTHTAANHHTSVLAL